MNLKFFTFVSALFILATDTLSAQPDDDTLLEKLKSYTAQGMSRQEIRNVLDAQGVTREQMLRISGRLPAAGPAEAEAEPRDTGQRTYKGKQTVVDRNPERPSNPDQPIIYGHDIFDNPQLTFQPDLNIATPESYQLGPGDEIDISIWGATEANYTQTISPEGRIRIVGLGPISLNGLTIAQATARLRQQLGQIYGGLDTGESSLSVSLGSIRSIQIDVVGEIAVPGTYTLPSLATVYHALYQAGGIGRLGTMRNIKLIRENREIAAIDLYEFLMTGNKQSDVTLRDGDVIVVPPYENLVTVSGCIKRPMTYEMKRREPLQKLLDYAGGFTGDAFRNSIGILRRTERNHEAFNVESADFETFPLRDGDSIRISNVYARYDNRVDLSGAVYKPGVYAIDREIKTLRQLIAAAEGIREDAFTERILLTREKEDWEPCMIAVDLSKILAGTEPDIQLCSNDRIHIPSIRELRERYTVAISGPVARPGDYDYAEGMTIEDLIVLAGGLRESASTVKVDISRRIRAPRSLEYAEERSRTYTIELNENLEVDGTGFTLEPFDRVYIRKSPAYNEQNSVRIDGEVVFSGEYALASQNARISDLLKRAGGITPYAFPEGARIERRMSDEERRRMTETLSVLNQQISDRDSLSRDQIELNTETYNVGFDLKSALERPGSAADIVLQSGDRIVIPEYNGTVRIAGAVMFPNAVVYQEGKRIKDYIANAGGFGNNARKKKVFVVYMNGMIETGLDAPVRPGCEIVVPAKAKREGSAFREIIGYSTSLASMAAIAASIAAISK